MLDLQSEEILYSNNELEKKFRDLETTIEQLSLLSDLSRRGQRHASTPRRSTSRRWSGSSTGMGYQDAYLFLVDHARQVVPRPPDGRRRAHRSMPFAEVEFRWTTRAPAPPAWPGPACPW